MISLGILDRASWRIHVCVCVYIMHNHSCAYISFLCVCVCMYKSEESIEVVASVVLDMVVVVLMTNCVFE